MSPCGAGVDQALGRYMALPTPVSRARALVQLPAGMRPAEWRRADRRAVRLLLAPLAAYRGRIAQWVDYLPTIVLTLSMIDFGSYPCSEEPCDSLSPKQAVLSYGAVAIQWPTAACRRGAADDVTLVRQRARCTLSHAARCCSAAQLLCSARAARCTHPIWCVAVLHTLAAADRASVCMHTRDRGADSGTVSAPIP